jgi:hypothetical protein
MSDEIANLILEHPRAVRGAQDETNRRLDDLTQRVSAIEQRLGLVEAN